MKYDNGVRGDGKKPRLARPWYLLGSTKMKPKKIGQNYNKIAVWWTDQMKGSDYGMKYVKMAMNFAKENAKVLDIGCGSTGRTIEEFLMHHFEVTGFQKFL